jgi:hypothetical protein
VSTLDPPINCRGFCLCFFPARERKPSNRNRHWFAGRTGFLGSLIQTRNSAQLGRFCPEQREPPQGQRFPAFWTGAPRHPKRRSSACSHSCCNPAASPGGFSWPQAGARAAVSEATQRKNRECNSGSVANLAPVCLLNPLPQEQRGDANHPRSQPEFRPAPGSPERSSRTKSILMIPLWLFRSDAGAIGERVPPLPFGNSLARISTMFSVICGGQER